MVHDFICLVTDKNRISYFGKITDAFIEHYNQHNNITEMTVITSIPLKPDLKARLIKKLEQKSGKTTILHSERQGISVTAFKQLFFAEIVSSFWYIFFSVNNSTTIS